MRNVPGWKGTPLDRFWRFIEPEPMSGCWLWTGHTRVKGYGQFYRRHGEPIYAHRFAWEEFRGPIPDGVYVCHTCDVPPCCNPQHLFLGTQVDNLRDCIQKGRMPVGSQRWNARLTAEQVLEIKGVLQRGGQTHDAIAAQYGVNRPVITRINIGETWKWVHPSTRGMEEI